MRLRRPLLWLRIIAIVLVLIIARRPLLNVQNLPNWFRLRFLPSSHARFSHSTMTAISTADLVRLTASELQDLLRTEKLTSVDLVKATLAQIDRHNRQGLALRAVISVAPDDIVLERAALLDAERARGTIRGPFHGIPILLKDVIKTHSDLGMPTTLGNFAFLSEKANDSAVIVDELLDKGLIIVGKTNPNLSSWKAMGSTNGWSAVGAQTTSAYVEGSVKREDGVMGHNNPCGASTGSAVGVSAGFAPIALGTEVDGSLVQPSARAGLYALKPTIGSTELRGIFAVSEEFDALGGMAKSVFDLAHLTELVLTKEERQELPADGYLSFLKRISVDSGLDSWTPNSGDGRRASNASTTARSSNSQRADYRTAIGRLKSHGAAVTYPISLPAASEFMLDGQPATITAIRHVFRENVEHYFSSLSSSEVRTLPELIQFNKENSDRNSHLDRLIDTLENEIDSETYEAAINRCRTVGRDQGVDKALREHDLDLVALPMDSSAPRLAAAAGYPIATVPLGTLDYNGRPFGLAIIASGGREDLLFEFMSAFETVSPPRPVPSRLTG